MPAQENGGLRLIVGIEEVVRLTAVLPADDRIQTDAAISATAGMATDKLTKTALKIKNIY